MNPHTGRQLWTDLHEYAWCYPEQPTGQQMAEASVWLAEFARRVRDASAGTCWCADKWRKIVERCPPPLTSRADLYWWTVAAHDSVNRRLGRPLAAPGWSLQHTLLR